MTGTKKTPDMKSINVRVRIETCWCFIILFAILIFFYVLFKFKTGV